MLHKLIKHKYQIDNPDTVTLNELIPDRCNFADREFESFVQSMTDLLMPCLPMALIESADGRVDEDLFEYAADIESEAREHMFEVAITRDASGDDDDDDNFTVDVMADAYVTHIFDTGSVLDGARDADVLANLDEHETVYGTIIVIDGVQESEFFEFEEDAFEAVVERAHLRPVYAFPWAWGHFWYPDDRITNAELQSAGFIPALYNEVRIAGIDGAGYSFYGQHHGPLIFEVCKNRGWLVPTNDGYKLPVDASSDE